MTWVGLGQCVVRELDDMGRSRAFVVIRPSHTVSCSDAVGIPVCPILFLSCSLISHSYQLGKFGWFLFENTHKHFLFI